MVIDGHEHVMLPTAFQLKKLEEAQVDKAILFTTTPHVEKAAAASLQEIHREMQVLYRLLSGGYTAKERLSQMQSAIIELKGAIAAAPDRFYGFGPVPLGLSAQDSAAWIEEQIVGNHFLGIGEFTPAADSQMKQLEPIFSALTAFPHLPIWVHTFHPVASSGLHILMRFCEAYPSVPVIFGHLGGSNWMEAIAFAKTHANAYLDLSAAFSTLAVKCALTEVPERCLFGSDAPFGEPKLTQQMIAYVSPSLAAANLALGDNLAELLRL